MKTSGISRLRQRAWAVTGLALLASAGAMPVAADIVTDWSIDAACVVAPPGIANPQTAAERVSVYSVDLATVHVAIYDTIVAFEGGFDPFGAVPAALPAGASMDAAVNEAAYRVLSTLYPSRSGCYAMNYQNRMAAVLASEGQAALDLGKLVGADVATQTLGQRNVYPNGGYDGREISVDITEWTNPGPPVPGRFQTPNANTLVGRTNPNIKPFVIASAAQFRPQGPPALGSAQYAEDYNEAKVAGIIDSRSTRTSGQDNLARFHTAPPPVFWPRNMTPFATLPTVVENARLLAALWVAHADATIGCFEAKYHFRTWRPRTAIPAGGTDGNEETLADASWLPNEGTPNHPEYPAAHSCAAGSSMEVIQQVYGTKKIDFTVNATVGGVVQSPMDYHSTDDFVKDIKDARVLGGMHFRTSTDDGTSLGRQIAKYVLKYRFLPVD